MSKPQTIVTIFGASGFIGRQVLRTLANTTNPHNLTLRLASRNALALSQSWWRNLTPSISHISPVQCDISDPHQVSRALDGCSHVINCVGILHETPSRGITFDRIHADGPNNIAQAIDNNQNSVKTVVHVSAIGASKKSNSQYARTKAEGESAVQRLADKCIARVIVLRPSIVFGPEDSFFNRFEQMTRFLPFLPLVGGGITRLQPVHVENVANAIVKSLCLDETPKRKPEGIYELGGKTIFTFRELMELVLEATGRRRLLLPLPFSVANVQGAAFEAIHNIMPRIPPLLTRDQLLLLKSDNVVAPGERTLYDLEIEPIQCDLPRIAYVR